MIQRSKNPQFLNNFLDYSLTILDKSSISVKEYNYDIRNFLKYIMILFNLTDTNDFSKIDINLFDEKELKNITEKDLNSYINYIQDERKNSTATRARRISAIKTFFKYLNENTKLIDYDPSSKLRGPKLERKVPKHLSMEESKKLLLSSKNNGNHGNHDNSARNFAIIALFLNCGLRLAELVAINIDDIDFYEKKIRIVGKGNVERFLYLNKTCLVAIKSYMNDRPPQSSIKSDDKHSEKALFLSERRDRISRRTVQYIIKEELKIAGIDPDKYSPHKLRHTAATLMYQYENVDIRIIQEMLGHKNINTTEIYTHIDNKQIRKAVESNPTII